jgi:hypothetical protein
MAKSNKSQKKHGKRRMRGGLGAADYAQSVYGGVNQQHAVGPNNNAIAMKPQMGGQQMGGQQNKGGKILQELAAPAILLYANNAYKRSNKSVKKYKGKYAKSRKNRFSRRR